MGIRNPRRQIIEERRELDLHARRLIRRPCPLEILAARLMDNPQTPPLLLRQYRHRLWYNIAHDRCTLASTGNKDTELEMFLQSFQRWKWHILYFQHVRSNRIANVGDFLLQHCRDTFHRFETRRNSCNPLGKKGICSSDYAVLLVNQCWNTSHPPGQNRCNRGVSAEPDHKVRLELSDKSPRLEEPLGKAARPCGGNRPGRQPNPHPPGGPGRCAALGLL